jgi:hypothetical protein
MMKRSIFPILALTCALTVPASADLIGYWDLEANFDDTSGNGNDGMLVGGASYQADAPAAITGTMSVAFDGLAGTYGIINPGTGGLAITAQPNFTVSMWVKGDGTANSDDRIFSESISTNENPLFNVGTHNASTDGTVDIYVRNGAAAETFGHAHSTGIAFDGEWHHVVIVGGADSRLDLYIDGALDTQFDHSNAPAFTPDTTTVGGILRAADCCNFLGNIDDVAMWNQGLIMADIAALADGSVTPLTLVPTPTDSDMDGMLDTFEQQIIDADLEDAINTLEDVVPTDDFDIDGSTNENEEAIGTDPINPDTDGDGANDGSETNTGEWLSVTNRGTDPFDDDSDNDDLLDGVENPDLPYIDADQPGTDPNQIDTDTDGFADGVEITNGSDPTDENDPGALPALYIDFNSTTQDAGPHPVGAPYQDYNAGHEVTADFVRQQYTVFNSLVGITPSWPDTPDNRTMQMIDRGAGNDNRWLGTQVDLLTDWLGVDTRTGNGGLGNYDGEIGTPTPMLLTLDGIPGGTYSWTSYHHDTENIHTPFTMKISTDGGATFEDIGQFQMSSTSPNGNPVNPATEAGPDPASLSSTVRHDFSTDGTADVILRFIPLSQGAVHQQIFGINGFDLVQTSSSFTKFAITNLEYDADTDTITITWPSIVGQLYSIDLSADLSVWDGDLEDSVPAALDADETSYSFAAGETSFYVRVRILPN